MTTDAIGDFLTIIRNGIMASKPFVLAPYSKMKKELAQIMKDEGFIRDFTVVEEGPLKKKIRVTLKYVDGESVIHEIKRISTPGRRLYSKVKNIKPVIGGLGVSILSTSRGLVTNRKAKDLDAGGEVLCTLW